MVIGRGVCNPVYLSITFLGSNGGRGLSTSEGLLIGHDRDSDVVVEPSWRALSVSISQPSVLSEVKGTA